MSYIPPKVWQFEDLQSQNGGKFATTNRPTAGATFEQVLPKGTFGYQLYTLNTPNGIKANILLEELKALGKIDGYDAFEIDIMAGDQFGSGFVAINPNSKIPALVDYSSGEAVNIFESGAILLYLAQKHGVFLPADPVKNIQTVSWLMWQVGSAPFLGGGFGHFYAYAPFAQEYPINRYAMETKRQLDVLNRHLAENDYMAGNEYSIADMAVYPWYGRLCLGKVYVGENHNAYEFLSAHHYTHIIRWATMLQNRPAVQTAENLPLKPIK